jgi:hypothetical protein
MPVLTRPNQIVEVTLPCEAAKDEADRIRWKVRALTCAETVQYEQDLRAACALPNAEHFAAVNALIRRVAVGWTNLVDDAGALVPFDDSTLNQFTPMETLTFARELPVAASWGVTEAKKPSPPSP